MVKDAGVGCGLLIAGTIVFCAIILFLSVAFGATGFLASWLAVPGQVAGPQNVREQWRFAYDYEESLQAIAQQVCSAEKLELEAISTGASENTRNQRASQRLAHEQNYQRTAGEYDGRLRDAFRAGLVKPADVHERAPTLAENKALYCPR
jgi:hypothetical protein